MRKYRDVKLDTELEKEEFPEEDDIFAEDAEMTAETSEDLILE